MILKKCSRTFSLFSKHSDLLGNIPDYSEKLLNFSKTFQSVPEHSYILNTFQKCVGSFKSFGNIPKYSETYDCFGNIPKCSETF